MRTGLFTFLAILLTLPNLLTAQYDQVYQQVYLRTGDDWEPYKVKLGEEFDFHYSGRIHFHINKNGHLVFFLDSVRHKEIKYLGTRPDSSVMAKSNDSPVLYFQDGNRYEGEFKGGFPHGNGRFYYENGARYEGEVHMGEKHGQGSYIFSNGEKYIGRFEKEKIVGPGTYFFKDSSTYKGDLYRRNRRW